MNIGVAIIAFNEEKNIEKVIEGAKKVTDEIIVVDSGSTDRTVELAEINGAKVFYRAWDDNFAAQRNFADEQLNKDFILHLDCDEYLTDELAESIKQVSFNQTNKVYSFKRINVCFGKTFKYGVFRPDLVERLYPKGKAVWSGKVHEGLQSELAVEQLKGEVMHFSYDNWNQYLDKLGKYTSLWSEDAFIKGKTTTPIGAFSHAIFAFIKVTFLNLGILDGFMGIVTCCLHFCYTLLKYTKLYEKQKALL